jgi:hypothetical protein
MGLFLLGLLIFAAAVITADIARKVVRHLKRPLPDLATEHAVSEAMAGLAEDLETLAGGSR